MYIVTQGRYKTYRTLTTSYPNKSARELLLYQGSQPAKLVSCDTIHYNGKVRTVRVQIYITEINLNARKNSFQINTVDVYSEEDRGNNNNNNNNFIETRLQGTIGK